MSLTPPLKSTGIFSLQAPFQAMLRTNVAYTCRSIRQISDFLKLGQDPYALFYEPNGLTKPAYDAAVTAGEAVVGLQSNGGHWVYVPTTHINSYPDMGGLSYTAIVLGISLGSIPDYLDLSALKTKIQDDVRAVIGITAEVKSVAVSERKLMSQSDHTAIEAARVANITENKTDYAKMLKAEQDLANAVARIAELEAYIIANIPP